MQTATFIDKSSYPVRGPWDEEPDFATSTLKGLECRVMRQTAFGHLCGYVEVPETHPRYDVDHNFEHCGVTDVTFAGILQEENVDDKFFVGLDCAHPGQVTPAFTGTHNASGRYREFADVVKDVERLLADLLLEA